MKQSVGGNTRDGLGRPPGICARLLTTGQYSISSDGDRPNGRQERLFMTRLLPVSRISVLPGELSPRLQLTQAPTRSNESSIDSFSSTNP